LITRGLVKIIIMAARYGAFRNRLRGRFSARSRRIIECSPSNGPMTAGKRHGARRFLHDRSSSTFRPSLRAWNGSFGLIRIIRHRYPVIDRSQPIVVPDRNEHRSQRNAFRAYSFFLDLIRLESRCNYGKTLALAQLCNQRAREPEAKEDAHLAP